MSVLNQMLRDLESRGAEVDAASNAVLEPSVPATPVVRPLAPPRQTPRASKSIRIAAWGAVALIVGATAACYAWYARHLNDYARAPQPLGIKQFAAIAEPAAAADSPVADAPVAATAIRPEDRSSAPADTAPARPVVATRTRQPDQAPIAARTATTAPKTEPRVGASKHVQATVLPDADARRAADEPQQPPAAPATKPASTTSATIPPSATENAAIVSRPASPGAALEARANELIARGRSVEAMALLSQVLQQAPENGNARATLAALQAESGRRDLALQTLLAGSQVEPLRFAAAAARLQADLGDVRAALATLDRVPEGARNAQHDAWAGGIAQRAGEHQRAVDAFRRALRAPNAPAIWWAGLAISLDALEQSAAALDAFSRAAADPSLPATARSYALGRISALSAAAPAARAPADGAFISARQ